MTVGFADVPDGSGSTKRVYYAPDGAMAHGEALVGGSWYHFDEVTGEMTVGFADVPDGSGSTKLLK